MGERLWVVLPVYNEEASIERVLAEWLPPLRDLGADLQILALNDGSADRTGALLRQWQARAPELTVVDKPNSGHGQTCLLGYRTALDRGAEWILQIDSDGQCDPRYLRRLWAARIRADVVMGFRVTRDDGVARWLTSRVVSVLVLLATGVWVADANVPYRLMRAARLRAVLDAIPSDFGLVNVLLAARLRAAGRIARGADPLPRSPRRLSVGPGRRVRHARAPALPSAPRGAGATDLTVLRRLTFAYLYVPALVFVACWLRPAIAAVLVAVLLAALWLALRERPAADAPATGGRGQARYAIAAVVVAVAWTLTSGIGGLGFQHSDWEKHNAMLKALVQHPWPVHFEPTDIAGGVPSALVYYLGFYLPAAIAGKALGWTAANLALAGWALGGLVLVLLWLGRLVPTRRPLALAVFVLASGMDVVGILLRRGWRFPEVDKIEWWHWPVQYSANETLWVWVPQHALGGWLSMALLLDDVAAARTPGSIGLIGAAAAFWSPFAALGLAPFAAVHAWTNRLRGALSLGNTLAAPALLAVLALYYTSLFHPVPLTTGDAVVPVLAHLASRLGFVLLEAGVVLALCALAPRVAHGRWRAVAIAAAATLTILPFVRRGWRTTSSCAHRSRRCS